MAYDDPGYLDHLERLLWHDSDLFCFDGTDGTDPRHYIAALEAVQDRYWPLFRAERLGLLDLLHETLRGPARWWWQDLDARAAFSDWTSFASAFIHRWTPSLCYTQCDDEPFGATYEPAGDHEYEPREGDPAHPYPAGHHYNETYGYLPADSSCTPEHYPSDEPCGTSNYGPSLPYEHNDAPFGTCDPYTYPSPPPHHDDYPPARDSCYSHELYNVSEASPHAAADEAALMAYALREIEELEQHIAQRKEELARLQNYYMVAVQAPSPPPLVPGSHALAPAPLTDASAYEPFPGDLDPSSSSSMHPKLPAETPDRDLTAEGFGTRFDDGPDPGWDEPVEDRDVDFDDGEDQSCNDNGDYDDGPFLPLLPPSLSHSSSSSHSQPLTYSVGAITASVATAPAVPAVHSEPLADNLDPLSGIPACHLKDNAATPTVYDPGGPALSPNPYTALLQLYPFTLPTFGLGVPFLRPTSAPNIGPRETSTTPITDNHPADGLAAYVERPDPWPD